MCICTSALSMPFNFFTMSSSLCFFISTCVRVSEFLKYLVDLQVCACISSYLCISLLSSFTMSSSLFFFLRPFRLIHTNTHHEKCITLPLDVEGEQIWRQGIVIHVDFLYLLHNLQKGRGAHIQVKAKTHQNRLLSLHPSADCIAMIFHRVSMKVCTWATSACARSFRRWSGKVFVKKM
jgi:hypothetical protein